MCLALQGMEVRTVPTPDQKRASLWCVRPSRSSKDIVKNHRTEIKQDYQNSCFLTMTMKVKMKNEDIMLGLNNYEDEHPPDASSYAF